MSPELISSIIVLAAKYGPEFITSIIALFKKSNPTLADIESLFAGLKPYSAYNIPEQAQPAPNAPGGALAAAIAAHS